MTPHTEEARGDGILPRTNMQQFAADVFSLSQTQRRLAHRYRKEALEAEANGNRALYLYCRTESDRLWRNAKRHLKAVRKYT